MPRLAIVHERDDRVEAGWKPVGVILGTVNRVDYKFLPGSSWEGWAANRIASTTPATTWEAEIPTFVQKQSNGHDLWLTWLPSPDDKEHRVFPTIDQNYQAYVLGATPQPLPSPAARPADAIPELGGYVKVRPG